MNHDNQDNDLRDAFRQLRDSETRTIGEFEAPVEPRGSWHVRRGTIGVGVLGTALLAGLLVLMQPSSQPGSNADAPDPMEIPFDDYSRLIEHEMQVVSLSDWQSPTDFFLDPES